MTQLKKNHHVLGKNILEQKIMRNRLVKLLNVKY